MIQFITKMINLISAENIILFIILIKYNKSLKEIYKCVMFRKSLVVQELQLYTVYMIIYISIYRLPVICIYYMHIYIYIYI